LRLVHDESVVFLLETQDLGETGHHGAIGPTDLHIVGAIERIVDWTREVKVVVEQRLDCGSVFVDIGL
jgi:hypothetical protein